MNLNLDKNNVEQDDCKVNRNHKATLFAKLFGEDKENALSLYNENILRTDFQKKGD